MPDQNPAVAGSADDIGADLSTAWGPEAPAENTESASPPLPVEEAPSPAASADGDAGRARDAAGRFTKAEQQAAAKAAAQAQQPEAPTEFKVPEKWPAQVKAELEAIHKANPEHAKWLLNQYSFMRGEAARWTANKEKGIEKLSTVQKQVEDLLAPGRQQRALKGIDDPTYIRNLVAAGDFLDKNPIEGLKHLAKTYGIDLSKLEQLSEGTPQISPELERIQRENAEIRAYLQQQTQAQESHRFGEAVNWVDRFASQVDATGNALYPHFDDVLPEIMTVVAHQKSSGQQVDVHAAYHSAIRMNESVWLKEQARRTEVSRKETEEKRKREIEEAKRAGFAISGSGGAPSETTAASIRGELERLYDK